MTYKTTITKKLGKRKCKSCGDVFQKAQMLQMCCSVFCSIKYARELEAKKEKKRWKEKKAKLKNKLKSYSQKVQEARKVFQEWIRLRDRNEPCISCKITGQDIAWNAGHYLKAELYSGLIFNNYNCHKQCVKCNHYLGGNEMEYRKGLIQKIGEDKVLELEKSKDELRQYTWTDEELEYIKTEYRKKIKECRQ